MARLLVNQEWYDSVSSSSYWEAEYERLIETNARVLFPGYRFLNFKTPIESQYDTRKPDSALIEQRYREWWVVEFELAHHPLGHVVSQVETFAKGRYGDEEIQYMMKTDPTLNENGLRSMLKGLPPKVLVIVNSPKPEWVPELTKVGAQLGVVEIFRSSQNRHVLRLNGELPSAPGDVLSVCRFDEMIPAFLRVESPAGLPVNIGERVQVEFDGDVSEWDRVDTRDQVWLTPARVNPLPYGQIFHLIRKPDGRLGFEIR